MGRGRGKGYNNIVKTDPIIHSNSARGKKTYMNPIEKKMTMQIDNSNIDARIKDLKKVVEEATTSDLQGVAMAISTDIFGSSIKTPFERQVLSESDDVLLEYAYGDKDFEQVKQDLNKLKEIKFKQKKEEKPFDYQDKNQEDIIHSGWQKGNSYRFVLEGTGDVFRELTKEKPHFNYIEEKLRRAEESIKLHKTWVHPDDSRDFSQKNNPEKFKKLLEHWKNQPVDNSDQEMAKQLNIQMVKGDFSTAKDTIKRIRSSRKKYSS